MSAARARPARLLAVASQKGGVGKTTTALNLAYSLGCFGERVLLVDADPQGGTAVATNLRRRTPRGLVQVLRGEASLEQTLTATRDARLSLLGSGVSEAEDALYLEEAARDGGLGSLLRDLGAGFAQVVIDAPAGIGAVVAAVLRECDAVLVPVRCQNLTLKTLPAFLRLVRLARERGNPRLRLAGVLLTMRDTRSRLEGELYRELESGLPPETLLRTQIAWDEGFEAASAHCVPVGLLPGAGRAARAYLDLALELRERDTQAGTREEGHAEVEGLF